MNTLYVKDRRAWRAWLKKYAHRAKEIWLVYYKKHTGRSCISYNDSVEEALCFGWVDSTVKRMDAKRFARRFTPRKPTSQWSASNLARVKKLIAAGRMTPAGLAVFQPRRIKKTNPIPTQLPNDLQANFESRTHAWQNFQQFPPFYRRMTVRWVASAKKEETRRARLDKLIAASARKVRIPFM